MRETYYECVFKFEGDKYRTEGKSVSCFMEGFWIDDWWEYTVGDKAMYWIPPSKIQHIEKKSRTVRPSKETV